MTVFQSPAVQADGAKPGTLTGAPPRPAWASPVFAQARAIRIGATFDNSSVEKANGTGLFLGSRACFNASIARAGSTAPRSNW